MAPTIKRAHRPTVCEIRLQGRTVILGSWTDRDFVYLAKGAGRHLDAEALIRDCAKDSHGVMALQTWWMRAHASHGADKLMTAQLVDAIVVSAKHHQTAVLALAALKPPKSSGVDNPAVQRHVAKLAALDFHLPISQLPFSAKFKLVLDRTWPHLSDQTASALRAMLTKESVETIIGLAAVIAALHAVGVGEAIDVVLLGVAYCQGGYTAVLGVGELYRSFKATSTATVERDLDGAAVHLAQAIEDLGVALFTILLAEFSRRRMRGVGSGEEQPEYYDETRSRERSGSRDSVDQSNGKAEPQAPREKSSSVSALASGRIISKSEAIKFLTDSGLNPDRAASFVEEIDGPISLREVKPGEEFLRYSGRSEGKGSFLTKTKFSSPDDAVDALNLKNYGNPATHVQKVVAEQKTMVLEGGIKNGSPDAVQTIIPNQNAFSFGPGENF